MTENKPASPSDALIGRPDKPFHKAECQCQQCLEWVKNNPPASPTAAEGKELLALAKCAGVLEALWAEELTMVRKPEGADAAESLLSKLVQVPKAELDREVQKAKAKKRKKKSGKRKK